MSPHRGASCLWIALPDGCEDVEVILMRAGDGVGDQVGELATKIQRFAHDTQEFGGDGHPCRFGNGLVEVPIGSTVVRLISDRAREGLDTSPDQRDRFGRSARRSDRRELRLESLAHHDEFTDHHLAVSMADPRRERSRVEHPPLAARQYDGASSAIDAYELLLLEDLDRFPHDRAADAVRLSDLCLGRYRAARGKRTADHLVDQTSGEDLGA